MRVARLLSRIGPRVRMPIAWSMARPTAGGSGIRTIGACAAYPQHPVAMFFAQVGDVCAGGLEDPQAEQPQHRDEREVAGMGGLPGRGEQGLELQVGEPRLGDSAGDRGAALCSPPGQEGAQVGFGVVAGGALETGQVGSHCQPQRPSPAVADKPERRAGRGAGLETSTAVPGLGAGVTS
jgi:hypothetical protein